MTEIHRNRWPVCVALAHLSDNDGSQALGYLESRIGWSTSKTLPIAIAENQISKGWRTWDGEVGGMREIFIPAGGDAYFTGSNSP